MTITYQAAPNGPAGFQPITSAAPVVDAVLAGSFGLQAGSVSLRDVNAPGVLVTLGNEVANTTYTVHGISATQNATADGILTSAALDLAEKSLVYFAEKDPQNQLIAYGCGFLVKDSNTAVSAAHNFEDPQNPGHSLVKQKAVVEAYFGRPFDGETIQLELKSIDFRLDLAVFSIQGRSAGAPTAFLPLARAPRLGTHCVLVAFQLGIRAEIVDLDPDYGVGVMAGNVVRVHPRHISYSCPSFSGDSGGAVVLGDGGIFAIHLFTANQWRERQNTTAVSDDAHMEDMAESVDSLIRGGGSVSIGLKLMGNI